MVENGPFVFETGGSETPGDRMRTGHNKKPLISGLLALALTSVGASAQGEELDLRTGVDWLVRKQSTVSAFHYVTFSKDLGDGFYVGQSIYSAGWGDAGGLFIGGFDAYKRFQISPSTSVDVGAFVGGGGGAIVVLGDGLMTKPQITLNQEFAAGFMASLGVGWTTVTGSAINTPSVSFALSKSGDFAIAGGHTGARPASGLIISAAKGVGRYYVPFNASRRNNPGLMQPMYLVGAEFTFRDASNERLEGYFSGVGAAYGDGAGYAEWRAGPRVFTPWVLDGRVRGFADVGIGFAGGGDVDTGGGLMASVSAGFDARLFGGLHVEAGAMGLTAVTGDYNAVGAFLRGSLRFDDPKGNRFGVDKGPARHWQLSTGLSYQFSHPGFRPPGHPFTGNDPVLMETGLDLFFGDHFYVTGMGYTVLDGMAGGFAMGTMGAGLTFPLTDRIAVAGEVFGGAAAGGGINTSGGLIWGGKAELDYRLSDNLALTGGVGKWWSLGGAQPITLHGGIKIPFTSFHAN